MTKQDNEQREPWQARIIEQERWTAATLEAYHARDYLRALQLLAMNGGDGGDVEGFIRSFCGECDPVPGWCDR